MKPGPAPKNSTIASSNNSAPHVAWVDGYLHQPSNSRLSLISGGAGRLSGTSVVFFDRDGVLVEDVHFLREPAQLRILPGVPEALRALQDQFYTVVATNQSGIARGLITEDGLLAIHSELVKQLSAEGVVVDALYYCPHLPNAATQDYSSECDCRKPKPGMLLKARDRWGFDLNSSYMIGDNPRDVEAGQLAGVRSILIGDPPGPLPAAFWTAPNLAAAVDTILVQRHNSLARQ